MRARIGAYAQKALHDPCELTANARAALALKYERQVDPEGNLPPAERARRAQYARRADMARLSLLAARARRREADDAA